VGCWSTVQPAGEGPLTFAVLTFGCRTNEADSCGLEQRLRAAGGVPGTADRAELVVVNTCTVTGAADQAARQAIRRVCRRNPQARIVATGCYATRRPADLAELPGVVQVVPNARKQEIGRVDEGVRHPGMRGRTVYTLKVQDGCDEACAYCIVPSTRGPGRSVGLDAVLDEARALAAAGFAEIVLTGVHLGAWGRDLSPSRSLADLLEALDRLPGSGRFRLSSLEPTDCTAEIVDVVARSGRFTPHFHLPLQHASDRLLRAMRRPYTLARYRRVVDEVRRRMPDAAIGSDVMVGFPGEEEPDVDRLGRYLEASPLTYLHVFPYSERPGTAAAGLRPKVAGLAIRARAERIRTVGRRLTRHFERRQVGAVRDGVTLGDGTIVLTDNFLKLSIPPGLRRNQRVRVRVTAVAPLQGEVIA
jgi:threonylcarbamoyladenosine tRNA methylthiotransferase MtaB